MRFPEAVEWTRPWALLALALPVAVWLLSRRRERPRPVPVGTFLLWREAPREGGGEQARRRVPPARLLAILAMVCAILALTGPRRPAASPREVWRIVVDRSPSTYLEQRGAGAGSGTRLEVAARRLGDWLSRESPQARLEWVSPHAAAPAASDRLPEEWRKPPAWPQGEPRWERFDEPGTIWLTDRVPALEPVDAGIVAAGGEAVPGPVASGGGRVSWWDGESIAERGDAAPARVALGPGLPEVLRSLVEVWSAERGVELAAPGERPLQLLVESRPLGSDRRDPVAFEASREGWTLRGRVAVGQAAGAAVDLAPLATWLRGSAAGAPVDVVASGPGRVVVNASELEEPRGDPALFALSWSRLLDDALLPAAGVVSLAERAAAGEALLRPPARRRLDGGSPEPPPWPLVAILSALAAGFAALAVTTRTFRRERP